jgi:hypothetical protein
VKFEITLSFTLILIGILMLLERIDFINDPWDYIWTYWPFILISLGFENLIGKKWGYVLGAFTLGLLGFLIALLLRGRFT